MLYNYLEQVEMSSHCFNVEEIIAHRPNRFALWIVSHYVALKGSSASNQFDN